MSEEFKTCAKCGKPVTGPVKYSQHFHDECAPEIIKFGEWRSQMTGTCEWATYPRLLEREFFERSVALYMMEQKLHTPIPDSLHWTRRFEYPWILSKLQQPPFSILDVGSGATALQFMLSSRPGMRMASIDPDEAAIAWIKNTISAFQKYHPQHQTQLGGFPILPFKDDEFDTGICISVLEHLPKDQVLPSIRELLRVSRKEVLITMDVVLGNRHPAQMDQSDFNQYMQTLKVEIPQPDNRITFQMDGYLFGVACLHMIKG
jgi:SAM-dependent methyltransferase